MANTDLIRKRLLEGLVIPAHPLALTRSRRLDERRQRALSRYYHAAGAGGLAVGVHTTQFAIRAKKHGLLKPVLELAATTASACDAATGRHTLLVAGICGKTQQASTEAELARSLGYHAGLLSLSALKNGTVSELIFHCRTVARAIPIFGFYLQPAAGGRLLPYEFWRRFVEIENVVGIKIAPFNRYQTVDVLRAVANSGRADIALYTGNDDNIVMDLLTPHHLSTDQNSLPLRFVGGLLGHWAVWTCNAVKLHDECRTLARSGKSIPQQMLRRAIEVTDCNAAFFDAANHFHGCIPGIHEILRRQGFLEGTWCLDPKEILSPGQSKEIDRVCRAYPHLADDEFVAKHIDEWLC
ncbi:MAG: dihydrodipicolinate synthase family protein [Pedosphaera sp.]|nr:dihydrodipicolinate synthase family protein [Pedosphaera sp.]